MFVSSLLYVLFDRPRRSENRTVRYDTTRHDHDAMKHDITSHSLFAHYCNVIGCNICDSLLFTHSPGYRCAGNPPIRRYETRFLVLRGNWSTGFLDYILP